MPSATPFVRGPQERRSLCDCQTFTPHDTPELYASAGREVCAVQRMSVPGRQSSLYERFPIRKFSQPGPYAGPYCTKAHDQRVPKHRGGPRSRPDPLSGHPSLFVFHPNAPEFSPSVLTRGAEWPDLPAHADTAHAAQALTETATPDPSTPAAVVSGKRISN